MTKVNPWGRDVSDKPATTADPEIFTGDKGRTHRAVMENRERQHVLEAEQQRETRIKTEITAQYRRIEGCSEGTAQGLTESLARRIAHQYPSGYVSFLEGQLLHLRATGAKTTNVKTTTATQNRAAESRRITGR